MWIGQARASALTLVRSGLKPTEKMATRLYKPLRATGVSFPQFFVALIEEYRKLVPIPSVEQKEKTKVKNEKVVKKSTKAKKVTNVEKKKEQKKATPKKAKTLVAQKKAKQKVVVEEVVIETPYDVYWEKVKKVRIQMAEKDLKLLFDTILYHLALKTLNRKSDYPKLVDILKKKFETKGFVEAPGKRVYNIAFDYNTIANKEFSKQLSEETLEQESSIEYTADLDITKKVKIKESMEFALDNTRSIQRKKLLNQEEEQLYAKMYTSGTPEEKELGRKKLTVANLRLVISMAKKYNNKGIPLADLLDEGYLGLQKAISKFDPERGFKFSTYATWWIRQSVTRAISDQGRSVRIPVHLSEHIQKTSKEERNLAFRQGKEPHQEILSTTVKSMHKINLQKLNDVRKTSSDPISFDKRVGDNSDSKLGDFLSDETIEKPNEFVETSLQNNLIADMLSTLEEKEREVVMRYFGFAPFPKQTNFSEIARNMEIRSEEVKSVYTSALAKLRNNKDFAKLVS